MSLRNFMIYSTLMGFNSSALATLGKVATFLSSVTVCYTISEISTQLKFNTSH